MTWLQGNTEPCPCKEGNGTGNKKKAIGSRARGSDSKGPRRADLTGHKERPTWSKAWFQGQLQRVVGAIKGGGRRGQIGAKGLRKGPSRARRDQR